MSCPNPNYRTRLPNTSSRKGQLFSLDVVVSLLVFIVFIVFLLQLWNLYAARIQQQLAAEELQLAALQVTDLLLKSPGLPKNWETNLPQLKVLGLQHSPGSLDQGKINSLLSLGYLQTKQLLNIERFDYNFKIIDTYGNIVNQTGVFSNTTRGEVVAMNRFVLINNQTRQVIFTLWPVGT